MSAPPKPSGSDNHARWAQWVHDQLTRRLKFLNSSTVQVKDTGNGYAFQAAPASGGGAPSPTNQYTAFSFIRSFTDYILVKDITTTDQHRVAKPFKLRNSITSSIIYSNTWLYSYPHNVAISDSLYGIYRLATLSGSPLVTERQGIVPQYLAGDIILAMDAASIIAPVAIDPLDTTATPGEQITLLDMNIDGRAWTAFADQNFGK